MEQKPATGQSAGRPLGPSALAEGLALRQRRRLKQAAACFEQAVTVGPSSVGGWLWLAVTRDNRGQEAEAIPAYREALSLGVSQVNTRAQAWTWLASSVSKTGRHAEALGALAEADSIGGYERRGHPLSGWPVRRGATAAAPAELMLTIMSLRAGQRRCDRAHDGGGSCSCRASGNSLAGSDQPPTTSRVVSPGQTVRVKSTGLPRRSS